MAKQVSQQRGRPHVTVKITMPGEEKIPEAIRGSETDGGLWMDRSRSELESGSSMSR